MTTSCPEGKVINPATGRCVKETKPKPKSCPEGKVINPATGRCVKDAKKMPEPAKKSSDKKAKRLPKLWEYDYKYEADAILPYGLQYMKEIKSQLQPGDILFPRGWFEEDGIIIVGKRNSVELPLLDKKGNRFLPAWVLEMGIKNGFSLQALIKIYKRVPFNYLILPKSEHTQISNGEVNLLLAYWVDYGNVEEVKANFAVEKVYLK